MNVMKNVVLQMEPSLEHVPDQVLVKVRKGQIEKFSTRISLIGLRILKRMHLLAGDFVVIKTSPKPIEGVLNLLGDLPEVEYAEPNYTTSSSALQHVSPRDLTELQNPWKKFTVKEAAIEAIDAKIDLNLPRIESEIKVNRQKIHSSGKNSYVDVTINDLLFLSDTVPVNLAEAVQVIDYATKMDINIVSNSWVRDGFSRALDDAITVAEKKGISFVAAATIAASISTGMSAIPDNLHHHFIEAHSHYESKPSTNVSAGVLSLYIAQEGKEGRSGRGRLIAKSVPSAEQIRNEWRSGSYEDFAGKVNLQNDIMVSQNFSFPGAKFVKLEIAKLNPSTNLGLLRVRSSNGIIIPNISSNSEFYETDYFETSLIIVEFNSNDTSTSIGSLIRNVRVIY